MTRNCLYLVKNVRSGAEAFVTASSIEEAVEIYTAFELAAGYPLPMLNAERFDMKLPMDMRRGLDDMLRRDPAGIARYDVLLGWASRTP